MSHYRKNDLDCCRTFYLECLKNYFLARARTNDSEVETTNEVFVRVRTNDLVR